VAPTDQDADGSASYRISELVEAAGVSRDMVKYYLRAGLLPPAHKPRPNLSLYTENHLALISLIRRFQGQTRLSLQEIAEVFNAAGHDVDAIELELLSKHQGAGGDHNIIPFKTSPQQSRSLNLPQPFLQELAQTSLLDEAQQSAEDEEQLAGLLWAAHSAGVPLAFFESAREKLAELADLELKTLIGIKLPGLDFSDTVDNVSHVDRIINRWMNAEKSRRIRNQLQRVVDNSERATITLLDNIYRPSHLFRERHRIQQQIAELAARPASGEAASQSGHDLCFACLLFGEYEQAISSAQSALAENPSDSLAIALIALAHGMQNNVDEAFEYGAQLDHCEDYHPAILQARLLALLLKVAKLSGVADTGEFMKRAGELFLELPAKPTAVEAEETLLLARANVAFPDFANSREQAIAALQSLLQKLQQDAVTLPELANAALAQSLRDVYLIYTLYYLGMLYVMDGEDLAAADCFEQVIQIDPASNFGERAYRQLG
jgi:DNA-binding transcriptional MerR regulator